MHRLVLTGCLPAVFAVASGAQEPPIVTEAEVLAALDASHPAVAERTVAVERARARVLAASVRANPVVEAAREDLDGPTAQTELAVTWQLPDAARRPRIEARQKEVLAAEAELSQELRELRLEWREAYAAWALAAAREDCISAQAEASPRPRRTRAPSRRAR